MNTTSETVRHNDQTEAEDDEAAAQWLVRLNASGSPDVVGLAASLELRAASDGLLEVGYRTVDTPVGRLLIAATEQGLLRVAYEREDHERVLAALATKVSPRILKAPSRLDPVARQLEEYFAGRRTVFDLALDLRLSRGFRLEVLRQLRQIGYGQIESYAQVAVAAGSSKAVRAVGSACATNPLPVVIPCHRVLRSDGFLGGYVGGLAAKRSLLSLEREQLPDHEGFPRPGDV